MFKLSYHCFLLKNSSPHRVFSQTINALTRFNQSSCGFDKSNTLSQNNNVKKTILNEWGDVKTDPGTHVKLKGDPDLERAHPEQQDEGDLREERHFEHPTPKQQLRIKQYADIIKGYIKRRQIKEAIDVLEVRMLKEDRVKPEAYIYNLLLGACGRVGYTKKAFMLYNDMKKRGLKVMGGTYTALFNACSNSPWPTDGLARAKHLYDLMIEKGYEPNDTNYNAMVKAFGRCGDLAMAFKLVDDMHKQGLPVKDDTINFLFQACISDKDAGFRHSLLVWRKLQEKKISPSIYTFNLLLRCVRDCGLGDIETTKDVIEKLVGPDNFVRLSAHESQNLIASDTTTSVSHETCDVRPNLLAVKPHLGNIMSLSEVTSSEHRLLLLGGSKGFLETMRQHKCTPDVKTFTQLVDVIPGTTAAEKELLIEMKKLNVKPDIDFFNILIKKKSMRCDYEGAREVLDLMRNQKFRPNLVTYGVLALGCKTKEEALTLLSDMKKYGYTLNPIILGAMLHQACYHRSYDYIFEIMECCLREGVPVNKKFLDHLNEFKTDGKKKLQAKEFRPREAELFIVFQQRYKTWLTEVQIDDSEDVHPWQQYRQNTPNEISSKYTEKDAGRFKPRHISKFKVKTSQKHRN